MISGVDREKVVAVPASRPKALNRSMVRPRAPSACLPISGLPQWVNYLGMGYLFSIPVPVYLMVIVTIIIHATLGDVALAEASPEALVHTMRIGYLVFTLICLAGVFVSLARNKEAKGDKQGA